MFYEEFWTTELVQISSEAAKEHFSTELDVQKKPFSSIAALQIRLKSLKNTSKRVNYSKFAVPQPASLLKMNPFKGNHL